MWVVLSASTWSLQTLCVVYHVHETFFLPGVLIEMWECRPESLFIHK